MATRLFEIVSRSDAAKSDNDLVLRMDPELSVLHGNVPHYVQEPTTIANR